MFGLILVVSTAAVHVPTPVERMEAIEKRIVAVAETGYKKAFGFLADQVAEVVRSEEETSRRVDVLARRVDDMEVQPRPMLSVPRAGESPRRPFKGLIDQLTVEPMLSDSRARIANGLGSYEDVITVIASYNTTGDSDAKLAFCRGILRDRRGIEYPKGFEFWVAGQCARGAE